MSYRSRLLGVICAFMTLCFFLSLISPVTAQEASQETAEPAQSVQIPNPEPVEQDITPQPPKTAPYDAATADITTKLEALEAAEADFLAAIRAQQSQTAPNGLPAVTDIAAPDTAGPKRKSLIPTSLTDVKALGISVFEKIFGWLTSPPFLAQLGAIALAYVLSPILSKQLTSKIFFLRDPPAEGVKFKFLRDYVYRIREFLPAAMMVILLALFAIILKAVPILGQDWLVKLAQGLAVVFLLYRAIKTFISNELFQKLACWILIPLALLMVFGYFDDLIDKLNATVLMTMGDTDITAMTVIRLIIFGALFFKLGSYSNNKGQTAIRSQEGMDAATQEVVAKIFQILLFTFIVILVLSAAKVPLSGLVMVFSAMSLGIGLGLQPIAANFVSGLIILFDRSVKVGDYVLLPDGQAGHVEAINMRSTTVETPDGKDIMIPNTKFTEESYENWTHKDPRQRYEVGFRVHYDTDLDMLEDILIPAVLEHPSVLKEPELPDLELRGFGEFGVDMAIEFWCSGIDDGPNKFSSDVNFIVWRKLKEHGIKMPYPQREVRMLK